MAAALVIFSELLANPREVTPTLCAGWTKALQAAGIRAQEVEAAAGQVVLHEKFFPTPADFVKYARPAGDADAETELAWQKVLGCIRKVGAYGSLTAADLGGDEQALWAVSRVGWAELCAADPEKRAITRAGFARLYHAARHSGAEAERVAGLHEIANTGYGEITDPALIGRTEPASLPAPDRALPGVQQALPPSVCPECKSRRHLLWCSALDAVKPLPAGESEDFAGVAAALRPLTERAA